MKVLILKPSSLGDVIQAMPVLRLLKRHLPDSSIYWWIDAGLAPLLEEDPDLAGIIPFHRRRWTKMRHWPEVWSSLQEIRRHRFDWVVDLQGLARSALVAWLANGALTVGLDDPREGAAAFYDIAVPRPSPQTHAVDWYLQVLPVLGVPKVHPFAWLPPRPAAAERVAQAGGGVAGDQWILFQPGARWQNKRWPESHFAELARLLLKGHGQRRIGVLGGAEDRALGEAIRQVSPDRILNLAGRITLPEMVEWIRGCRFIVSNDTGPMHVAAALQKPMVALFGPTNPQRTGPYGMSASVLQQSALSCVPCMKDVCHHDPWLECLRSIAPGVVAAFVESHYGRGR